MHEFILLSNLNNRNISLQIIKSFSVLILNCSNTTTLYYVFSNNFLNQIISNDYEKYDEDFLSYYVNFIKSLSLKIDQTTIQFFFHKQINSFPLVQSALKLYNHNDPMIKNVVRNIILTILKSKYNILSLCSKIWSYHRLF
jgi:protein CLEC16A